MAALKGYKYRPSATAHVEVRETLDELPERERSSASANIVASEDGQITEVRVSGGRAVVGVNDIVRKGELLISGIMTVGEDGLRYEYASGQVFAKVNRQVTGEAALTQEKNVYTGQECTRRSVLFFGKERKFFRKISEVSGKMCYNCSRIEKEN